MDHRYKTGIGHVGSYQVSGRPYLTGSEVSGGLPNNGEIRIDFPAVTKSFTVVNRASTDIFVHFDTRANADVIDGHHYMTLPNQDDSFGFDVKTRRVYISMSSSAENGEFELHAELTGIDKDQMSENWLSGSGINGP